MNMRGGPQRSVSAAHRKFPSVRFLVFSPDILLPVPLDHTGAQVHKPQLQVNMAFLLPNHLFLVLPFLW